MGSPFLVTLDSVAYSRKPQGYEPAAITRRLQATGPTELDAAAFCEHVKSGKSWCGGCFNPKAGGWGEFIGQRIFALDFDNASNKQPIKPEHPGYLDPIAALNRCELNNLKPMCLYFTMSAKYPWPKFRIVFDIGDTLDHENAQAVTRTLLGAFPEADQACKNVNRIFYGSNGEVWECWRVWGDEHE